MKQGDILTEGIFQTTPDGRYLNANPALARMFGDQSPAENNRQTGVPGRERDITELRRFQAVTRELAAIVENSSDGIISTTLDQRIVS